MRELLDSLVNNINLALINLGHHLAAFGVYSLYLLSNVWNSTFHQVDLTLLSQWCSGKMVSSKSGFLGFVSDLYANFF